MKFLLPILVLAVAALAGCEGGGSTREDEEASFFGVENYEWGNEQDQADIRQERQRSRVYE
jgi:hypothetical protein